MPPFKDGTAVNTIERAGLVQQYIRITAGPQRGRYVHQLVAEAKLGRPLLPNEEVDHEDGDTFNNDPPNLIVREKTEHGRLTRQRATARRRQRKAGPAPARWRTPPES